ncbi:MAG TPA: hypothetical protein VD997_02380 [Phycisphaerales bacterium]|nr:hypothetical protein [Phycisphaerales bacterium]
MRTVSKVLLSAFVTACVALPALGWDAYGHRLITTLAVESMRGGPEWLKGEETIKKVADGAVVPDRWRGTKINQLTHLNNPEHYLDVEDLAPYGLSLKTLPTLRYEYVKAMALAKERAGKDFKGRPVNPARDTAKTDELPGFLPYGITEQYAKVQNAFLTVRVLEKLNDPRRAHQLQLAKENAIYNMGVLSHYVGDAAQPLHMTKHHHGWVGENPKGYTTDRGFHSYIDGKIITHHRIKASDVRKFVDGKVQVEARAPWEDVLNYLETSFVEVEPLYELKKTGELEQARGKEFIEKRLASGASMLGAMYRAAWESAEPTQKDVDDFVRYDGAVEGEAAGAGNTATVRNEPGTK